MSRQHASAPKSAGATRLGFNGQLLEPWGCYSLGHGHRVYNPSLLVFHSPDTFSPFSRGGVNAYAYCSGDPVNATDPSGRWAKDVEPYAIAVGSIVASFFLFRLHASVYRNPDTARPGRISAQFSMVGALVGMYGGILKLAGSELGGYVSLAGTILSATGAFTRYPLARAAEKKGVINEAATEAAREAARTARLAANNVAPQSPGLLRSSSAPLPGHVRTASVTSAPVANPVTPPVASRSSRANPTSSAPASLAGGPPQLMGSVGRRPKSRVRASILPEQAVPDIRGIEMTVL